MAAVRDRGAGRHAAAVRPARPRGTPAGDGRGGLAARHHTVAGSTHASLIDDKGDAARSSRAIRDVVNAVREASV